MSRNAVSVMCVTHNTDGKELPLMEDLIPDPSDMEHALDFYAVCLQQVQIDALKDDPRCVPQGHPPVGCPNPLSWAWVQRYFGESYTVVSHGKQLGTELIIVAHAAHVEGGRTHPSDCIEMMLSPEKMAELSMEPPTSFVSMNGVASVVPYDHTEMFFIGLWLDGNV